MERNCLVWECFSLVNPWDPRANYMTFLFRHSVVCVVRISRKIGFEANGIKIDKTMFHYLPDLQTSYKLFVKRKV